MINRRALSFKILLVGAVGAFVCGAVFSLMPRAAMALAAPVPGAPLAAGTFKPSKEQLDGFKIAPVQLMSFRTEQSTDGAIANNDETTTLVFSPYSGPVAKLYAKPGDVVKKGAPLMAIAASEFVQGQNDLVTSAGTLATARAQLNLSQAAEQRQHELLLAKAGAQKDWLQSELDLSTAQNSLRSAEIGLNAARNRLRILGKSDREIKLLETEPNSDKMAPEALVRAPIGGTVIARQVGLGQYLQSAAGGAVNPVFTIGNLSSVWLVANVREDDSARMQLGQALEVQVPAWPQRLFKARVTWIAPSIDPLTHRLAVRAEIGNRDGALKPMMFASFHIQTGAAIDAIGVAQSAIVHEGLEAHVFVAGNDGSLALRPIHTGRSSGAMVEVLDGLSAGERIVTSGALFIDRAIESQ